MLILSSEQQQALAQRVVMRRDFIWIEALDPQGDLSPIGFWSDVGNVTVGERDYYGGVLFQLSTLSAKSDMSIPGLAVTFSGIAPEIATQVRGNVLAQRPIEVLLGLFDVDSHALIPSLIRRFVGKIDDIEIKTPAAGDKSTIELTCESTSRALTIQRTETRSSASHAARNDADKFFDYTAGQAEQTIYFGRAAPVSKSNDKGGLRR